MPGDDEVVAVQLNDRFEGDSEAASGPFCPRERREAYVTDRRTLVRLSKASEDAFGVEQSSLGGATPSVGRLFETTYPGRDGSRLV